MGAMRNAGVLKEVHLLVQPKHLHQREPREELVKHQVSDVGTVYPHVEEEERARSIE
jgi:hypothetical protein